MKRRRTWRKRKGRGRRRRGKLSNVPLACENLCEGEKKKLRRDVKCIFQHRNEERNNPH